MGADDELLVRVEIPKGSRNKYEWDEEVGAIVLDRRLYAAVTYPTDYGYIPGTLAPDGDEVDALVCVTEPTFPGCVIRAKPIAVLQMSHEGEPNPKVLCVPMSDPAWSVHDGVEDLPEDLGNEILHFFDVYTDLEGKDWDVHGWGDRAEAGAVIAEARRRHDEAG